MATSYELKRPYVDDVKIVSAADAASRRGRRSRVKGKVFERAVAKLLRGVFGDGVKRGWQSRSGTEQCDVEGTPFHVECKHGKQVNLRAALRQAIADTDGRPPVVIARDDRQEPVVVMRLADWLDVMRERQLAVEAVDRLNERKSLTQADAELCVEALSEWCGHLRAHSAYFGPDRVAEGERMAVLADKLARKAHGGGE